MPKLSRTNTAKWDEKKGLWRIVVTRDGKRKEFTSAKPGRTGQREANKKADAWLNGTAPAERLRVRDAYRRYYEHELGRRSKSHEIGIESMGRVWILPRIGRLYLDQVTLGDLQNILDDAEKAGRARKTIRNIQGHLSAFFKFCRINGWTTLRTDDLMVSDHAPVGQRRILQADSLQILFSCSKTILRGEPAYDEYINAYRFAAVSGLRPGELIGARWSDIWDGVLHIQRSINVFGDETTGKNDNARRNITLTRLMQQILSDQKLASVSRPTDTIFGVRSEHTLYNRWRRYCKANGIPAMSLYELRHTYISIVSPALTEGELKPIVGHSQSMDTLGIYSHELDGDARRTAEKIDSRFQQLLKSGNDPEVNVGSKVGS